MNAFVATFVAFSKEISAHNNQSVINANYIKISFN